jgi:hypothetical protein
MRMMVRSRVFVAGALASFALVLLRCSGFSADPTPTTEGGAAEAAAEAEAEAAAEAGTIGDGSADASETSADAARPPATTCAELQDAGTATSDFYTLNGIERYCEMTLAGGGWTLIARSASGASGAFGWKQSQGDVHNTGAYSLDATKIGAFTVVLFGKRGTDNSIVPPIYMKSLPAGFLTGYTTKADSTPTTTVDGGVGCLPDPGTPLYLQYVGFTGHADDYFFRDNNGDATLGLTPTGWVSATGCNNGGNLHGEQAAIFVR